VWVRGYIRRGEPNDLFWIEQTPRRYGCLSFLFDVFMLIVTAGWWLLWILIREWRGRRR